MTVGGDNMSLKAENVFKPGAFPEYTYVSRNYENTGISYELRLKQALRTSGCLTSIIGPSKMGKTILCERVIGFDNIVEVSGADFNVHIDFWATIAAKVGLPYMGEITTERAVLEEKREERDGKSEKYILSKDKIIQYYIENNKVLVIDDFHYASPEMQMKMDHIETWKEEDLKKIALKGFDKLGIKIDDAIAEKLAVECLTSPQLMQYICLSICTLLEDEEKQEISDDILERAYRFTTMNFNYADVVSVLSKGPNPRGQQRKLYRTIDGKELDLYGIIVESLAKNPPLMEIGFETFYNRILDIIDGNGAQIKLDKQTVKNHLKHLQEVLGGKEEIYQAIEWKDGTIYVLDPLFLLYLRWGKIRRIK